MVVTTTSAEEKKPVGERGTVRAAGSKKIMDLRLKKS